MDEMKDTTVPLMDLDEQQAIEGIIIFTQQYGQSTTDLACHAALPSVLTPDLLYRIWASFLPQVPWIAVSDILLSSLCREVGYEMYEMHRTTRNLLIRKLQDDERFGQQRINELAGFLTEYINRQTTPYNQNDRDLFEAQRWTAMAFTQPASAAKEIAYKVSGLTKKDGIELLRLATVSESLWEQLKNCEKGYELITYTRGMERFAHGDKTSAIRLFKKAFGKKQTIEINGIELHRPVGLESKQSLWDKVNATLQESLKSEREPFGLPQSRTKSIVMGSFNIRELGRIAGRSAQSWEFLSLICSRFDLLAIQEVQDNLEGIRYLHSLLGKDYGLVVSDTTGKMPGSPIGSAERLAFLFRWARIRRTELAFHIIYDRSSVENTLLAHWNDFNRIILEYEKSLKEWEKDKTDRINRTKPELILPYFLKFICPPYCVSFEVIPRGKSKPIEFLMVNAHLLYGVDKYERRLEFDALIDWLVMRAKNRDFSSYENIIMMGDCNIEFGDANISRADMDESLKRLNSEHLKGMQAARVNFPLIDPHPTRGLIRTNARQSETYDQIAIFAHDKRLPDYKANETAGSKVDGYDYGAFKFTDLFAKALKGADRFEDLTYADQKWVIDRVQWDISDHMPVWFRLPVP